MVLVGIALVTEGVREVRAWIEGTFRVHELVLFDQRTREERVGLDLASNGVRLADGDGTRRGQRTLQFVEEIGAHDLVVELHGSLAVQREPLDFAAGFATSSLVPVIFGAGTAEFHDMVASIQFIGELPQMITQEERLLVWALGEKHRVRVVVEHPFP